MLALALNSWEVDLGPKQDFKNEECNTEPWEIYLSNQKKVKWEIKNWSRRSKNVKSQNVKQR